MIELTRMNQVPLLLNADLIEYVEVVPDTVITLTTGQKLMVRESAREITQKIIAFRREIFRDLFSLSPELVDRIASQSS
jgi:flagellar protein FlbD